MTTALIVIVGIGLTIGVSLYLCLNPIWLIVGNKLCEVLCEIINGLTLELG